MHGRALLLMAMAAFPALRGDALGDLRKALQGLRGLEPVKGNLEYQFKSRQGDPKAPRESQGKAAAWVEEDPSGLRIQWSRALLDQSQEEALARVKDPEKEAPTRRAMSNLDPAEVTEVLNAGAGLLRALEGAQVLEERAEAYQGQAARFLSVKLQPRLSKRDQKYVKESQAQGRIWVGSDGLPLAAQFETSMKGRAFLVVSFEQREKSESRFARVGGRLVTTYHRSERSGSGGGESGQTTSTTTLVLR
ncbi:MAG: hypothetical protein HY823_08275 [Acidobacteria bacterium]|nr:hypothetical protein [Acidobacteriota bacterium]